MVCEGCGNEEIDNSGYDDSFYHNDVIPNVSCSKCNKSTIDLKIKPEPLTPKYPVVFRFKFKLL